jgi:integrase
MPGKEVLLFPFDYAEYITAGRDLAFDFDKYTPGKRVYTFVELLTVIRDEVSLQFDARERYLTKDEATRLIDAINQTEQNIHLKYIIPMLILTGARRGEVLKAKHEDFNLNQLCWTIPTSKSGKKRVLPITPQLLELYKSIPKDDTPYLFASAKSKKPYVTIYVSWNSARTRAGLKDLRMHDLRHSFASALVNNGRSLYEVQTLLGHSTSKMTQRYAHLSNENLMKAASL